MANFTWDQGNFIISLQSIPVKDDKGRIMLLPKGTIDQIMPKQLGIRWINYTNSIPLSISKLI